MTEQQPQPPGVQISPDKFYTEIGARYGQLIGQSTVEILELRSLLAEARNRLVQAAANETELQGQIAQLTTSAVGYEDHIHDLQKELDARPTAEQVAALEAKIAQLIEAGPTVAQTAAHELAKGEA